MQPLSAMTDPFSVLGTSLTVADSSKRVIDVCTEYLSHAKNAPKEFQTIIEDIHDLAGTIKRLESFSRSREGRRELEVGFDQWQTPLRRLDGYAKDLVKIVERQDLKIGIFHELGFRTRWPTAWREVQALLVKIEREKNKLHLAAAMDGV